MKLKSVKSFNRCKSPLDYRDRTSLIQTSYDIVKAHIGELRVESKEGEGSEFSILLPI